MLCRLLLFASFIWLLPLFASLFASPSSLRHCPESLKKYEHSNSEANKPDIEASTEIEASPEQLKKRLDQIKEETNLNEFINAIEERRMNKLIADDKSGPSRQRQKKNVRFRGSSSGGGGDSSDRRGLNEMLSGLRLFVVAARSVFSPFLSCFVFPVRIERQLDAETAK